MERNMTNTESNQEKVNITISDTQIQGKDVSIKGVEKTTTVGNVGPEAVVVTGDDNILDVFHSESSTADLAMMLAQWQADMEAKIESAPNLLPEDKEDLKEIADKIKDEAAKAEQANPGRLERLVNSLAVMGPDIFEVAIATLVNPLSGIGLVLKKINDKATIERKAQSS
jgi:hypothetical protein